MIRLPKQDTKLLVAIHGWSGIVLGLLLYAVVVTGMAAVFAEEIGIWSAGHLESQSPFQRPVDDTVRKLAARTAPKYYEAVDLFEIRDRDLGVFFHRHETAESGEVLSRGMYYQIDKKGHVLSAQEGIDEDVFGPRNDDALSSFLVDTHVRLHIPNPWGLILTGILGLAMLVAAVSGMLIHRHLFKDIFTLRRNGHPVLAYRDRHSVAGTWSLPFAFILAFTGSFFSFFGTVGFPIVAMSTFAGNQEALNTAVFGSPGVEDKRSAPVGNVDRILSDATLRGGGTPTYVSIENFNRADSLVMTDHDPKAGDIEPPVLVYQASSGAFLREKPLVGIRPSFGGTLTAIMQPLHFGNFAGALSKALWFGLGFAMCYVTLTGLRLWLVRRREGDRSLAWLERMVTVIGFGLPFALVVTAAVILVTMPLGRAVSWTPAAFLIGSALAILGGVTLHPKALDRILLASTGGLLLLLPIIRFATGGPDWSTALAAKQPIIVALDLAMTLGGSLMLWHARPRSRLAQTPLTKLAG